jgi:hypothetical protein
MNKNIKLNVRETNNNRNFEDINTAITNRRSIRFNQLKVFFCPDLHRKEGKLKIK